MNTLILLFIGLFAVLALIITSVVTNKRKRRREAEADEQRRIAELEALEHKLKAMEDKIAAQTRELEDREGTLKKETEALILEREDVATIRKQLNTEAERIAEERAILNATVQEHLTKEKQLQNIVAEQKVKYEQLAALEENLKRTSEELTEKDLKLAALKEEIEGLAAMLMKEKKELDSRDSELKSQQDKLKSEREEMEHKIIEEKKNLAEERAAALKSARESLDKIVLLEAELEERAYDLKALEDNIAAQKEEIEVHAAALMKEREELDTLGTELKSLRDNLKPERDKLEQKANELREFHERLTSKEKSLNIHESKLRTLEDELSIKFKNAENESNKLKKRLADVSALQERLIQRDKKLEKELKIREDELQKKEEVVKKLLTKLSDERENIENEKRSLEERITEIARRESVLVECDKALKSKEEELTRVKRSLELKRETLENKEKELKQIEKELNNRKKGIEKEGGKPPDDKNQLGTKPKKVIDLGEKRKIRPPISLGPGQVEETDKVTKGEKVTSEITRIESPFVEINFDEVKVILVLPEQEFKPDIATSTPQQLTYELELNGDKKTISAKVNEDYQGTATVEEKRIELEKPLKSFQTIFPDELEGRNYSYRHDNGNLYAFIPIGNNRGRMHYLFDRGDINPLPKRDVWVLLNEDFELETEPDLVEERWIWENYKSLLINLRKSDEVTINNIQNGEKVKIPCETTFSIEGEQLVDDDFKEQIPLFVGKSIKIKAPEENPPGWTVRIQNKHAGGRIITESWTGTEAIELKLPDNLPCECGEFQVDICEREERIPVETLFFRYIPFLQLEYQQELIVPDAHDGHRQEFIKVILGNDFRTWEIKSSIAQQIMQDGYLLELPPEKDTLHFSIAKMGKPETETRLQITTHRLKWRTSEQETWSDKPLQIKRDELISGTDLYLFFCTNDFNSKYELLAILEANNQKLQEANFIRKGMTYNLLLNQFFDTVKQNIEEATVSVELWKAKENELLHKIRVLNFTPAILRCKLCDFKSCDRQKIISHIEGSHLSNFTEPLTLEEMRKYDSSLPHKIYKCNYCDRYVRGDDPANPTSSILKHIEEKHNIHQHPNFQVIDDIDEIRKNVVPYLPYLSKCTLCGIHFTSQDKAEKIKHLFKSHSEDLYYV